MSEPLYRLVYCSRHRLGREADAAAEIDAILTASQRNNGRDGITGALIFNSGIFAQVLEGPRRALEEAFERIQCDERHGDLSVLAYEPVKRRCFPNWSMGLVGRWARERDLFDGLGAGSNFLAERLQGERILALMLDLALEDGEGAGGPAA
jgi:hypothetical protein